jgi:hypothetical protein
LHTLQQTVSTTKLLNIQKYLEIKPTSRGTN